ncbi:hypothetical protein [Micromonospora sp. WMMD1082]|uniref:hypothetical protein n=1 Tax=Micromonospora sp. WMMD1082 TaxID=3016104 RepID=UPI002417424E|nr:hypothetical protein [Micromonospora sp. WMMD1082]MDG4796001.1 hypothetical protein [Micromonospora sp. WMMD1082]
MRNVLEFLAVIVAVAGLVGLGALLYWALDDEPTDRERALERQIETLKRANRMGAAYFDAQAQMREEMTRAASARRGPVGRASVGRASVPHHGVIDGDWR